jgi:hypothetical protein
MSKQTKQKEQLAPCEKCGSTALCPHKMGKISWEKKGKKGGKAHIDRMTKAHIAMMDRKREEKVAKLDKKA